MLGLETLMRGSRCIVTVVCDECKKTATAEAPRSLVEACKRMRDDAGDGWTDEGGVVLCNECSSIQ